MRAIWSGAIGFGLVNIPVKIYSASEPSTIDLDMLDKKDHANIRYERVNANTGKKVDWDNIVKGYKYDDDYVILTDTDFEKAAPEKDKVIAIEEFVKEEEIPPYYFDTPYYLEPGKSGQRAYALLLEALKKTGKVAIGTYVMRSKENLSMLMPMDDALMLMHLRFPSELRSTEELNLPGKTTIKAAEMKMAVELINQLSAKTFDASKYKNTYNDKLMKIIETKRKGGKVSTPRIKISPSKSKDLMAQLKESLNRKKAS